jgi:hypothetical protein
MFDVSGEWWALNLAEGWEARVDEHCVTIAHPDGVGVLQVSAYRRAGTILSRDDILEATQLKPEMYKHLGENTWGDFRGFQLVYAHAEIFWRRWWLANGSVSVVVTYNCEKRDEDKELVPVNDMLASLRAIAKN